jgi:isoleucyl-tRNA synthetase
MFKVIDTNRSFKEIADEVRSYWKESGIEEKSLNSSLGNKPFRFLEGPPTANGRPHLGHAMTRVIKDIVLRYKYMTGHEILGRAGGWDCHGLPVEIEAEKHFGFNSKREIEDFGIEAFNAYCKESVFKYIDEFKEVDSLIGFWVDHEKDYITLNRDYMESEWWALKTMFENRLLSKDFKILPYCPRCGTSLSSHEVSQGYEEVTDISVYVRFKVIGEKDTYMLAWTTTPWTLPSNQFLVVNPKVEYSLVEYNGSRYYLATAMADKLLHAGKHVKDGMLGSDLVGKKYDQLLKFLKPFEGNLQVVGASYVSVEEGTGIVHTSPAFGADDFETGKRMKTRMLNPVSPEGKYNDPSLPWNGLPVMDANPKIIDYLKETGVLFKIEKIKHTYPFCYRCKSPLIYYPLDAWFINVSENREKIIETNSRISWYPAHLKQGRFGNFLEEAKDWALSRNRYWGTPLPVWKCKNGHYEAIGDLNELAQRSGHKIDDLHRPFVDALKLKCTQCGEESVREPYVIDTWFDSGSATYASIGYPRHSLETHIPVDFITEAIDQTRGWYYTLHVISTLLFNSNAYRNVLTIEFVLDAKGRKMSKSEGNSVLAIEALQQNGPDPLRLFFMFGVPWKTRNYDTRLITEISRKTLSTLLNVYSFFASNANIDKYKFKGLRISGDPLDQWIISRLNSTILACNKNMEEYLPHEAFRSIMDLIEQVSNTYLRLSRRKFWSEDMNEMKESAYSILYSVLEKTALLLAPIAPFTTEYLYRYLTQKESVHLEQYPSASEDLIKPELEKKFVDLLSVIETVRRMRQQAGIKGRQPLKELVLHGPSKIDDPLIEIIKPEINCKSIIFGDEGELPVKHSIKLNYSTAAPMLKGSMRKVESSLISADPERIIDQLREKGSIVLEGSTLSTEHILIETIPKPGYVYDKDERTGFELFLNVSIDADLAREGLTREIIRRIQVMRKDLSLEYDDRISVVINADSATSVDISKSVEAISSETLADTIDIGPAENGKEWDIDGTMVKIVVRKNE